MITIYQPQLIQEGEYSKLQAIIDIDGKQSHLWIKTNKKYGKYLCWERSDAFVVGLLSYAMRNGHDITCQAPIGEYLYYQLSNYLIDAIYKSSKVLHKTQINAPVDSSILANANAVGTGISCGVDSFHALSCHSGNKFEKHNITHLAFNNVGSHGIGEQARKLYEERKIIVEDFCKEYGYELIESDSNIADIVSIDFLLVHTYLNGFIFLAFQKLYSIYYYASAQSFRNFSLEDNEKHDTAYYDLLLLDTFSTPTLRFYSEGATLSRLEKTKEITDYLPSYKYLNVCTKTPRNCGHCEKCKRTMLALDALEKLELYKDVFDIEYYKTHSKEYYSTLYLQYKLRNPYYLELYPFFRNKVTMSIRLSSLIPYVIEKLRKFLSENIKDEKLREKLKSIYHNNIQQR